MALWQMDVVGGMFLADGTEAKVVTGLDDHSRYCVIASVVARATGRAVCLASASALRRFGVPGEVLTDNGKQFTDRFGRGGEVLFDRICRDNGITHRLTQPRSPTCPPLRLPSTPGLMSTTTGARTRRSGWPSRSAGSAPPRPGRTRSCCPRLSPWPRSPTRPHGGASPGRVP